LINLASALRMKENREPETLKEKHLH